MKNKKYIFGAIIIILVLIILLGIYLVSFLDDWSADDYSNYKVYEAELDLATKIQQCYK